MKNKVESLQNVRSLSSMTNIERQEWGLILTDELKEDPYSWLVRHNFLEDLNHGEGFYKVYLDYARQKQEEWEHLLNVLKNSENKEKNKEIDIGLSKSLKGPNPPIYL